MPVFRRKKDRKAKMPPTRFTAPNKKRRQAYKKSTVLESGTNPENHAVFRGIGFPDMMTTNLVYTDSIILDPSASTITPTFQVTMNDCFDPQSAIGGGQPTFFDQFAAIYRRYQVNGCKLSAIFSRSSGTTAGIGPYICGITTSATGGLPTTDAGALISVPNTTFAIVTPEDGSKTVVATYSQKKTFPFNEDSSGALVTAGPVSRWEANIFASPQGTDVETPINVVFVMEFNVTFSGMKQVLDL